MELANQFLIVSAAKGYIKANYLFGGAGIGACAARSRTANVGDFLA
jgi:hypothetical protein